MLVTVSPYKCGIGKPLGGVVGVWHNPLAPNATQIPLHFSSPYILLNADPARLAPAILQIHMFRSNHSPTIPEGPSHWSGQPWTVSWVDGDAFGRLSPITVALSTLCRVQVPSPCIPCAVLSFVVVEVF